MSVNETSARSGNGLTLEEVVARLINLEYVPAGFTVLDMTSAFAEETLAAYENAKQAGIGGVRLQYLEATKDVCKSRHELAVKLMEALSLELRADPETSLLLRSASVGIHRLALQSVRDWAVNTFGISPATSEIAQVTGLNANSQGSTSPVPTDTRWEDVTIKIYSEYKIGWKARDERWYRSSYREIGLLGTRKTSPNALGVLFLRMSLGHKYPTGRKAEAKDKTSLSKLRKALCQLTHLSSDPFLPFNEADGWKPRFRVVDDRRNADERAKARAVMVELEPETPAFESEDDDTDRWLKEHDRDNQ